MVVLLTVLGIIALRLLDVSVGTLRITNLVRGKRFVAGILGFFESLSWVVAAGLVLSDLDEWYKVAAYAAGFGLGTALGGSIDRWIADGQVMVRIMAPIETPPVAGRMRDAGFRVTVVNAEGRDGEVRLTISAISRKRLPEALQLVHAANPAAFVTVDEVEAAQVTTMKAARIRK
ncbi:MAG TPA: DUF5698 domain-containing protein [Acidimicrobiia bacterium]|jgi:uncharacterized protein YebE (UPF0316 family)